MYDIFTLVILLKTDLTFNISTLNHAKTKRYFVECVLYFIV